jgi:hypothetical protein
VLTTPIARIMASTASIPWAFQYPSGENARPGTLDCDATPNTSGKRCAATP